MRFNEEAIRHRSKRFLIFQDPTCRWWAEVEGREITVGFDFARMNDSAKERIALLEAAGDYIDRLLGERPFRA
jgi:hypothetical protein